MATKSITRIADPGTVIQSVFADLAAAIRMAESGLDLTAVGALNAAVRIGMNTPILVYNSDSSVHYIKFGVQAVTAPTNASNGIPVLANSTIMLNSGAQAWVRSDSALVFGYKGDTG